MTEVYLADIEPLRDEGRYLAGMGLIPKSRRERISSYRYQEDRMRGMAAGLLLEIGLRDRGLTLLGGEGGLLPVSMAAGPYGKPEICGAPGTFISLTHAAGCAAAAVSDRPCGIDVERVREAREQVARRHFHEDERRLLDASGNEDAAFFWIWTRKESYIKALGEGMRHPLGAFSVTGDFVAGEGQSGERHWLFTETLGGGYFLSACVLGGENPPGGIRLRRIDLEGWLKMEGNRNV